MVILAKTMMKNHRLIPRCGPWAAATCFVFLAFGTQPARAANETEIMDIFPRDVDQYIGAGLTAGWEMEMRQGKILREFRCLAHDTIEGGGADLCPKGSQVLFSRELVVSRLTHRLNIDAHIALWRILSLQMRLPVVLLDRTNLKFDAGVTAANSSVDPYNFPSLFRVGTPGNERSGISDPSFHVRVNPMSYAEDRLRPSWSLDLSMKVPATEVRVAGNTAVGEGIWEVEFSTALSWRPRHWVEPYFRAGSVFRFAGNNSLFEEYASTQTLIQPGHGLRSLFGVEFMPYQDLASESELSIDIGGSLDYRFEGREYTELSEALGNSSCDPLNREDPCELTTFYRTVEDPDTGEIATRKTDGITDVEQYGVLHSWLGVNYQILRWVRLRTSFTVGYEMPHFITFADAGRDLDGANQVEVENSKGDNEFNPVYNDAYDSFGKRFRSGGMLTFGVSFSLQGKF